MKSPTNSKPSKTGNSGRDFDFEVIVGSRIRAARFAAGMTQRALGERVGVAYQKIQKYELGKDRIAVSTLHRIANALKIHPSSFFYEHPTALLYSMKGEDQAQRSTELVEQVRGTHVARALQALIQELERKDGDEDDVPDPAPPAAPALGKKRHRVPLEPTRAVINPLLAMLQQAGTGDAAALAQLLGRALAEAEKIMKGSTKA